MPNTHKQYPVAKPDLAGGNELKYVTQAMEDNWITWRGEFATRFEEAYSKRHGYPYGIGCTSGTTALTLAVAALNIGEGDEVIVQEFTMVATPWSVTYNRAKPVFVDCDDRMTMDVDKIEEKITPRTKAIMPAHVFGRLCNMPAIQKIADRYGLKVIEDAALAGGTKASGDITCYSFFANKIMTSGEGGICLTKDERLAKRLEYLKNMAFDEKHTFLHKELGFNFRMTSLHAACALGQLERLDEFLAKRKLIEQWYTEELSKIPQLTLAPKRDFLWMFDVFAERKDELVEYLDKNGVETRHLFKPMSMQPMYYDPNHKKTKAYQFSQKGLYLPTYTLLTHEDVIDICGRIREFYIL